MCPGEMLLPLRIKYKQPHRSLRRTPTKRYKRNGMMQALISFTNLVGNRKAPLLRKVIETRKATPSAICCPQSLQELLYDLQWGLRAPEVYYLQTLLRGCSYFIHQPVPLPTCFPPKPIWLVGVISRVKKPLPSLFSPVEVQLETYINALQLFSELLSDLANDFSR